MTSDIAPEQTGLLVGSSQTLTPQIYMESHVSGGITPLSVGELRQSILAVLVGNPLFMEEEQLLANHLTYECEDAERLTRWLRNVRLQDAKRGFLARNFAALDTSQHAVCVSETAHRAEMQGLLKCRALDKWQKRVLLSLMTSNTQRPGDRLQWLGHCYLALLGNMGRIPKPNGFSALLSN